MYIQSSKGTHITFNLMCFRGGTLIINLVSVQAFLNPNQCANDVSCKHFIDVHGLCCGKSFFDEKLMVDPLVCSFCPHVTLCMPHYLIYKPII